MLWNKIFICTRNLVSLDMVGMGNRHLLNQRGQSTVEYILLLSVIISIFYAVINSARFKQLLGENGTFATRVKNEAEWNYRFSSPGNVGFSTIKYEPKDHPSYFNTAKGTTHFIGPKDPYPRL